MAQTPINALFDTTVFIHYLRGDPAAQQLIRDALAGNIIAGYSIITEAELWSGIKGQRTVQQLKILLASFQRYRLTVAIARRAGEFRSLHVGSLLDYMIAATAEQHQLTLFTKNVKDFQPLQAYISLRTY